MALIKIELSAKPVDGQDIKFKAPCDCTQITGLLVEYPEGSKEFTFRDCHDNNLAGIGNLFSAGAYVKAILDTSRNRAYLQNGDVNGYLNSAIFGTYTHSAANLTGSGENGKFKATASGTYSNFAVNGVNCSVRCGEDTTIDLIAGCWYTFIRDGNTVNFNLGGTGSGFNFKVVGGTTQPVSPKENTIWVNTGTGITNWFFSEDDPNLLNYDAWAKNVSVQPADATKSYSNNVLTLRSGATADMYTEFGGGCQYGIIPCKPGKTYKLTWKHTGAAGYVYIFPNASTSNMVRAASSAGELSYTAAEGVYSFTFRFGVSAANSTASFSNIRITEAQDVFDDGTVWIRTGSSSNAEFNALKKHGIRICPVSAVQYIGGVWVNKTVRIYQGGKWVELISFIYDRGQIGLGGTPSKIYTDAEGAGVVTLGANYVALSLSGNVWIRAGFPEAVNFSAYSKLKATVIAPAKWSNAVQFRFGVDSGQYTAAPYRAQEINGYAANTEYTIELDISSYNLTTKPWFELYNGTGNGEVNSLHLVKLNME